jgi:hypothetical protein
MEIIVIDLRDKVRIEATSEPKINNPTEINNIMFDRMLKCIKNINEVTTITEPEQDDSKSKIDKPIVESWKPIETAPIGTPVFVKDENGKIGIGIKYESIRNDGLGVVQSKVYKVYFNTLDEVKFWLPINWPGV